MDRHIEDLITETATSHQLPPTVVRAMVLVESGGNPNAARYEPDFYKRYIAGRKLPPAEGKGLAISYGLLQIMGETARTIGYTGQLAALFAPETGLEWGCRFLRRLADRYLDDGGWETVCRAYNGGPGNRHNPKSTYPAKVLARIPGGVWPSA